MFLLRADKNKLTLSPLSREPITSGSVNVYRVRFEFSPDWDSMTKTACFRSGAQVVTVLLDEACECVIPWEVTDPDDKGKRLYAGVYGTAGGSVVLPTVWADLGEIQPGVNCGAPSRPPTPSQYEQLLIAVEKKQDKLTGLPGQVVGFDGAGNAVPVDTPSGGGEEGGIWGVGHGLKVVEGDLTVETTDNFEGDNTLPMTAAGVEAIVGNIEVILKTI